MERWGGGKVEKSKERPGTHVLAWAPKVRAGQSRSGRRCSEKGKKVGRKAVERDLRKGSPVTNGAIVYHSKNGLSTSSFPSAGGEKLPGKKEEKPCA